MTVADGSQPLPAPPPSDGGDNAPRRFALAHLSDPHVPCRLGASPAALFNKRVMGYLSWRLRRAGIHRMEVLDALRQDLLHQAPDHVAVTGDIVNISLPIEFRRAADWLRTLGEPEGVTVVPGNHDAYVHVTWERSWGCWRDFMRSDAPHDPPHGTHGTHGTIDNGGFPFVRRRDPVALIGLSTAQPTAPGRSSGTVGRKQLDRLDHELRLLGAAGLFRVVLLHHPPLSIGAPVVKQLTDAEALRQVVADAGAELILHGHEHRFRTHDLAGRNGAVPVFGVPSASMLPQRPGATAGQYHLHYIARHADGWSMETHVRSYDAQHRQFVETKRLFRVLGRAAGPAASRSSTAASAV